jgi:hypothetical protein
LTRSTGRWRSIRKSHVEHDATVRHASDGVEVSLDHLRDLPTRSAKRRISSLVRTDSAVATHDFVDYCREGRIRFSVGYGLTEPVRAAVHDIPEDAWVVALDQDGSVRDNGRSRRSPTAWIYRPGRKAPS